MDWVAGYLIKTAIGPPPGQVPGKPNPLGPGFSPAPAPAPAPAASAAPASVGVARRMSRGSAVPPPARPVAAPAAAPAGGGLLPEKMKTPISATNPPKGLKSFSFGQ